MEDIFIEVTSALNSRKWGRTKHHN